MISSFPYARETTLKLLTYRQLTHLQDKQIPTKLFEDAPHDEFMNASGKKKCDDGRCMLVDFQ